MFRYEKKYVISDRGSFLANNTLKSVLMKDLNSDGEYVVRSLYFDDIDNSSYNDVVMDKFNRVKYRIRCYDYSDMQIFIEEKRKVSDRITKQRTLITRDEFDRILQGDVEFLLNKSDVCKRFYSRYRTKVMRPKLIIEYTRTAYIGRNSDLRITFDKNIRTYKATAGLFTKSNRGVATKIDNPIIMEVKYYNFIPSTVPIVLSKIQVLYTNFSKYALSFEKLFVRTSWR